MHVILGPASSGKTSRLMESFTKHLDSGEDCLLLLPTRIVKDRISTELAEQRSGLMGSVFMTLNQFLDRTVENILHTRDEGLHRISNFEAFLIIRLLIRQNGSQFRHFRELDRYPGLIRMVYSMVQEMRTAGEYFRWGLKTEDLEQDKKWQDLNQILLLYVRYLENNNLYDNFSLHRLGREQLEKLPEAPCRHLYLDGFYDFSSYQLDFLCSLFRRVEQEGGTVTITLPDISFPLIQDTLNRLREEFHCEETVLTESHPYSRLADLVLSKRSEHIDCSVWEIQAFGAYREVEHVANQISGLLQAGYHYRDMAVITREPDKYQSVIRSVFRHFRHPWSPSRDELLKINPLIIFIRSLLQYTDKGIDNAGILSLIHSGYLPDESFRILRDLNEYVIDYKCTFHKGWMSLIDSSLDIHHTLKERLEQGEKGRFKTIEHWERHRTGLEDLRKVLDKVLGILFRYHSQSEISGDDWVSWIASLFQLIDLGQGSGSDFEQIVLRSKDYMAMRKLKDSLQSLRKSLSILGLDKLPFKEYLILFDEMIRDVRYRYRVYTEDAVALLTPYDAREQRFKISFVLGLNEGEFPGGQVHSLSDDHERRYLNRKAGRLLLEDDERRTNLGLLDLYTALTRSTDRLYLCHTPFNETGRQLLPSLYLEAIRTRVPDIINIPARNPEQAYSPDIFRIVPSTDWMELHDTSMLLQYQGHLLPDGKVRSLGDKFPFLRYSREMRDHYRHQQAVHAFHEGLKPRSPAPLYQGGPVLDAEGNADPRLQKIIRELIAEIHWTPLRLETAGNCRYRFFLSEILGIKASPIPKEEIQSDLKGLFYHKVMEIYVAKTRNMDHASLPAMEILDRAMEEARDALSGRLQNNTLFDLEWQHFRDVLTNFVRRERVFREEGEVLFLEHDLEKVAIPLPGRPPLVLSGRIDRVDILSEKSRVIDYKSGTVKGGSRPLRYYIRPLFVNQGVLYARALDRAVSEVSYVSVEKDEVMDLLAGMRRYDKSVGFESLWDQKSKELEQLLDLLQSGDFSPYTHSKDLADQVSLDFYGPFMQNGVEMEWDNKCGFCDYRDACPRKEKLLTDW